MKSGRSDGVEWTLQDLWGNFSTLAVNNLDISKARVLETIDTLGKDTDGHLENARTLALDVVETAKEKTLLILELAKNATLEAIDSIENGTAEMRTLPRFPNYTLTDALYAGGTVYETPGVMSTIYLVIIDLVILSIFWHLSFCRIGKDFIKSFFLIISALFGVHCIAKLMYSLTYLWFEYNCKEIFFVTFITFKTMMLFTATGSSALLLIALATHLNRRPPARLHWKVYLPILASCLCISLFCTLHTNRAWYWMIFLLQFVALSFNGYCLLFVLLLCNCKTSKFSRFEKDVAVIHARSNLGWIIAYHYCIIMPLLCIDFWFTLAVSTMSEVAESLTCLLALVPELHFPCSRIYFLMDNSIFIRPLTVILPLFVMLPVYRQAIREMTTKESVREKKLSE